MNTNTFSQRPASCVSAIVRSSGQPVLVDDIPCRIGLLVTYNPWHYDQEHDAWYHDDDLFFLGRRLQ